MEEGGHYYTVYYTALAAGFEEKIAYHLAALAQMPDEISNYDASSVHEVYCIEKFLTSSPKIEILFPDLLKKENDWRYLIETVLHSLTGGSSSEQQSMTYTALLKRNPESLEFGLLLHRLGDTYAHSIIELERELYKVRPIDNFALSCIISGGVGHLYDGHNPDYPHQRPYLFLSYLSKLYSILLAKSHKKIRLDLFTLDKSYRNIFSSIQEDWVLKLHNKTTSAQDIDFSKKFIKGIINECERTTGISIDVRYKPENDEPMTLDDFLKKNPDLKKLVDETKMKNALQNIKPEFLSMKGIKPPYTPLIVKRTPF